MAASVAMRLRLQGPTVRTLSEQTRGSIVQAGRTQSRAAGGERVRTAASAEPASVPLSSSSLFPLSLATVSAVS